MPVFRYSPREGKHKDVKSGHYRLQFPAGPFPDPQPPPASFGDTVPPACRTSLAITEVFLFVAPAAWNLLEECWANEPKPARSSNSRFRTTSPGRACAVPPPSAVGVDRQLWPKRSLIGRGSGPPTPPGLGPRLGGGDAGPLRSQPAAAALNLSSLPSGGKGLLGFWMRASREDALRGPAPPREDR